MAIPFLNNVSLNNNEIQNVKLHNTANIPSPSPGHIYFDTDDSIAKYWNGSSWVELTANTDNYVDGASLIGTDLVLTRTGSLSDLIVDLSSLSDNTTYSLGIGQDDINSATIELIPSVGDTQAVTINGVTNQTKITEDVGLDGAIYVGLADDVIIENTLTVQGNTVINTTGAVDNLILSSTDTTTAGAPDIVLYANAPATNNNTLGTIVFQGKNGMVPSSSDKLTYAGLFSHIIDKDSNQSILAVTAHKGNGPGAQATVANFSITGVNNGGNGVMLINPNSGYDTADYNLDVNGDFRVVDDARFESNVEILGNLTVIGTVTTNNVETVSTSNGVIFEGNAADDNEVTLLAQTVTADRTIVLPDASGTVALTSQLPTVNNGELSITVSGTGLTATSTSFTANQSGNSSITIAHADTSTQTSVNNSGRTYIQDITLDTYGHITGISSATETVVNTQLATASALIDVSAMGSNTTASFTHGLASKNLIVQLYDVTTGEVVYADIDHTSTSAISVIFASTPVNDIRVVIIDAKDTLTDKTVTYS